MSRKIRASLWHRCILWINLRTRFVWWEPLRQGVMNLLPAADWDLVGNKM